MGASDDSIRFRYPGHVRYLGPHLLIPIFIGAFLGGCLAGLKLHPVPCVACICVIVLAWWLFSRRYGLNILVEESGLHFTRGSSSAWLRWDELTSVRFSSSGIRLTAANKKWRIHSSLCGWTDFLAVLRDRFPAEALRTPLTPPFRVRTKWTSTLPRGLVCASLILGGLYQLSSGQGTLGLVILGFGLLILFLIHRAVLWYGFREDALLVQRLTSRDRYPWSELECAAIRTNVLTLAFGSDLVILNEVTRVPEEIFLAMEKFWDSRMQGNPRRVRSEKPVWSWPKAILCWTIVPVLTLITLVKLTSTIRTRLDASGMVCVSSPPSLGPCRTLYNVWLLLFLDISVVTLMGVLIVGIYFAGEYCARHQERLLAVFPAALALTMIAATLILLGHSTLLAALLYYMPLELANVSLASISVAVGFATLFGLIQILLSARSAIWPPPIEVDAIPVSPQEEPGIWQFVNTIAGSLGAVPPDNILLGLESNFYATESPIHVAGTQMKGQSLYVSIPLTRLLSEPEFRAVVGHELAHFLGLDTRFSFRFFPLYNAVVGALNGMINGYHSWTILPVIYMLHFFLVSFGRVECTLAGNVNSLRTRPLSRRLLHMISPQRW